MILNYFVFFIVWDFEDFRVGCFGFIFYSLGYVFVLCVVLKNENNIIWVCFFIFGRYWELNG